MCRFCGEGDAWIKTVRTLSGDVVRCCDPCTKRTTNAAKSFTLVSPFLNPWSFAPTLTEGASFP